MCGGTGAWSQPYKDAGYDVRVVTLPDYDLLDVFRDTVTKKMGEIERLVYEGKVYGILAAPTCTQFSLARTTAKTPRNFNEGMILVRACLDLIWKARVSGSLKFWALENPMGYLRQFLGKPPLTFNPCDYGDNYTKKTDLWGYYNLPTRSDKKLTAEELALCKINARKLPEIPSEYFYKLPKDISIQAIRRSMTSKYFAEAFFKANR